jgi:hypothetical protein
MPIYLVTPLAFNADALRGAIEEKFEPHEYYALVNNAGWLVDFKGTTVEVSAKIGVTGLPDNQKSKLGSTLITAVGNYYGLGSTDMWEWLKTRFEQR